jgi:hypothetical protein
MERTQDPDDKHRNRGEEIAYLVLLQLIATICRRERIILTRSADRRVGMT